MMRFAKNTQISFDGQSFEISFEMAKLLKVLSIDDNDDDDMEILRQLLKVKASVFE